MAGVSQKSQHNQQIGLPGDINATLSDNINATLTGQTDQRALSLRFEEATSHHFRQLRKERDSLYEYDMTQVVLLALASLIWDVFVIYYHLSHPPHPKFRLRFMRRMSIYAHIWSGVSEVALSVASFVLYCNHDSVTRGDCSESDIERHILLVYGTIFCSTIHCVTAAYQTPQVFGMHIVMVPVYTIVVLWKAISLLRLAIRPESLWLMLQLFFTHHIYVWCRAMHVILEQAGVFSENLYSVSILFAGVICGPIAMGPAANFAVVTAIVLVALLWLPYQSHDEQMECRLERRSNMLLNPRYREALKLLVSDAENMKHVDDTGADAKVDSGDHGASGTPADTAAAFQGVHHLQDACNPEHHNLMHSTGTVSVSAPNFASLRVVDIKVHVGDVITPAQIMIELEPLPLSGIERSIHQPEPGHEHGQEPELEAESDPLQLELVSAQSGAVEDHQGTRRACPSDATRRVTRHTMAVAALRSIASELAADSDVSLQSRDLQDRVRVIFDALDSEGTGFLTKESITSLLVTWGVPYAEAMHCFDLFDAHSSIASRNQVSFHEFFIDWEPVWRFQLSRIDEAVSHFRLSQELAEEPEKGSQNANLRRLQLSHLGQETGEKLTTTAEHSAPLNDDAVAAAEAKAAEAQLETARVQAELKAAQERIAALTNIR